MWNKFKKIIMIFAISLSFIFDVLATDVGNEDQGWEHSLEIYALALNIRGDSQINDISADVDVDPSFIMDHIDMGAMLRLEGIYENKWGYYLDYSFMNLSGKTGSVLSSDLGILNGEVELRQGILETKAFKRYKYDFGSIDYMAGFRWWDNDLDTKLYTNSGLIDSSKNLKEDWVDYLIGARLITDLTEKWKLHFSIDVGLSGDTDFTSSILTGVRYQINDWSDLNLSYKSIWVDYDNGSTFKYNTASQGFLLGWAVHF